MKFDQQAQDQQGQPETEPITCTSGQDNALMDIQKPSRSNSNQRRKGPLPLEAIAYSVLCTGLGWCTVSAIRLFRRQQQTLQDACGQLQRIQEQLAQKEQLLGVQRQQDAASSQQQESALSELSKVAGEAQGELASAREACKQAHAQLERSMSDLCVTETEMRAARSQLHTASRELQATQARLEATEGELGLTRSQNELMRREVDILRRQLREAGQQLEGHLAGSRKGRSARYDRDTDWD